MNQQRYQTLLLYLVSIFWLFLWSGVLAWPEHGWLIVLASYFLADAGSYILHYIVDFYGDADQPGMVQAFQLHHAEPAGIVDAPVSEVMFPAAWIVVPLLALLSAFTLAGWVSNGLALSLCVIGACWGYAQLFHRWAHLGWPGLAVRLLQKTGLVLSPSAHADHHRKPYTSNYAVVNGWSNRLLDRIKMPAVIDAVLSRLGFVKRQPI